ncbi:hypothetical protein VP177E371_P0072 [Vibrio phage 177E37-1]|nr:hypothetical protein VP177E371_P0072 [Vibrio phage 177E37-1]
MTISDVIITVLVALAWLVLITVGSILTLAAIVQPFFIIGHLTGIL